MSASATKRSPSYQIPFRPDARSIDLAGSPDFINRLGDASPPNQAAAYEMMELQSRTVSYRL